MTLPRTKRDLIIEVWEQLDCESVGAKELQQIQLAVAQQLGDGAVDSPTFIARVLADEGAVLRHPELLQFDTAWREQLLGNLSDLEFTTLAEAEESMRRLEAARKDLARDGLEEKVAQKALRLKAQAQILIRSQLLSVAEKELAKEVAEWLTIWLNDPEMFGDWLSLRKLSPDFTKKFGQAS